MSFRIVDRRSSVLRHPVGRDRPRGKRPAGAIDAVVLHQMGFSRGANASAYDGVPAHFAVLPDGTVLHLHDATTLLHASNDRGIAVEFAGNFPNEQGRAWAAQRFGSHTPPREQIIAGRLLVMYLARVLGVRFVFAHRQANAGRKPNCPGPHIWYNVGEWCVANLGLDDGGTGYAISSRTRKGAPIPNGWRDPRFELL
ncbi:MAG TPA: N-acetylmuramoyl-L-alanine amidase [Gemmataceae bacterium]